jgi:hypothetical protein
MLRRTARVAAASALLAIACAQRAELAVERGPAPSFETPDSGLPDGAGSVRALCPSNECPADRVTCPSSPFPCSVALRSDDDNCGACGRHCPHDPTFTSQYQAVSQCVDGACRLVCAAGGADCNGLPEDGCETAINSDPRNCGACGIVCEDVCTDGVCGCPGRFPDYCVDRCTNVRSDIFNCGLCGHVCPPSAEPPPPPAWHASYGCVAGACDRLTCNVEFDFETRIRRDWADCNADIFDAAGDGCEIDIANDRNNCGGCGTVCPAGRICRPIPQGIGGECVCACGSDCFNVDSDIDNCGACGVRCPGDRRSFEPPLFLGADPDPAHGKPVCEQGVCNYRCSRGWADCDGDADNGCETNVTIDSLNCGACGNRCDGIDGHPCVDGKCLMKECEKVVQ